MLRRFLLPLLLPCAALATPVVGHLSSPAGWWPALHVYAWSSNGRLTATATSPGQPSFHLDLPPGQYRLFATPADPGVPLIYVGHTACGSTDDPANCTHHDLTWVHVGDTGPVQVDVTDWHIEDALAHELDRALHRADGAGDSDPASGAPRFFEYPAAALRGRAPDLARGDFRPEERLRLHEALESGHINFAGRAAVVQWPCGNGCVAARIVDLETGRVTRIPTTSDRDGLLNCPEHLAYRRDSRLLRVSVEDGTHGGVESYFLWDPDNGQLHRIGAPPPLPARCTAARFGDRR